ncbi:MAG TPA: glycoside hydrolase family 2 TIM barrel-domain containing protein, partial [Chitinophagaceae bacterium]
MREKQTCVPPSKTILLVSSMVMLILMSTQLNGQTGVERRTSFDEGWKFFLGDDTTASSPSFNDSKWRVLDLPHDWSIELPFDSTSPTGTGGGALRGGIGWYRKTFTLPASLKGKNFFIDFDGVYMNSEVWLNGRLLGNRPNGYISFRYDLTPLLKFGNEKNVIAVRVNNSQQPNSRWYSGSGIYRNVWLVTAGSVFVEHWGTYITTPQIDNHLAKVAILIRLNNTTTTDKSIVVKTTIFDADNKKIIAASSSLNAKSVEISEVSQQTEITTPHLWAIDDPYLYTAKTEIIDNGKTVDEYTTPFGIRYFRFDVDKGFFLNGKPLKIIGICDHHDLGCLGTAVNTRALQRQLQMLKGMGINGIRTSHNPPAPELLDLADKMGFVVMDEAFDMWKKEKNPYDYHLYWDNWYKIDLRDQVLRDRNHPSVFIWSIGNEIMEQWGGDHGEDTSGRQIARDLAKIIHGLDTTRPITSALNDPSPVNEIYRSGALDLVGFNYNQNEYKNFPKKFPGKKFIATETISSINTRGHYDMPSDSIRRWPANWDKPLENA